MPRSARVFVALLTTLAVGCGEKPSVGSNASDLAARGQSAFYDTLFGVADRNVEAVALLEAAVAQDANDGRSQLLLGMLHMLRFGRNLTDPYSASDVLRQEISKAQDALDAAVPLLPDDRRVPGFRAAATYSHGVVTHDDALVAVGLRQLREAITLFPEFNTFALIGAVGPVVPASDPLYQEVMQYVGNRVATSCTPFTRPAICGNAGAAAHNVEGSLVLFGDLFAKAGNASQAETYYRLALASFPTTGGSWRFRRLAEDRMKTVAQRVALYQDNDPSNDPRFWATARKRAPSATTSDGRVRALGGTYRLPRQPSVSCLYVARCSMACVRRPRRPSRRARLKCASANSGSNASAC